MKLHELEDLIFSDLKLICGYETFFNVSKNSFTFRSFKDREVVGIRATKHGYLEINIK